MGKEQKIIGIGGRKYKCETMFPLENLCDRCDLHNTQYCCGTKCYEMDKYCNIIDSWIFKRIE